MPVVLVPSRAEAGHRRTAELRVKRDAAAAEQIVLSRALRGWRGLDQRPVQDGGSARGYEGAGRPFSSPSLAR
jgi:hypothetical protein